MPDLKICFSTLASPDWSWHDVVKSGPQFGYQGVEIRLLNRETNLLIDPHLAEHHWPRRQRELKDAGFQVAGLASSIRFDDPSSAVRQRQLEIGQRYLDLGVALGAEFIRVFGDLLPPVTEPDARQETMHRIADGLRSLGELAQPTGIQILLETHGDFSASPPSQEIMQLVNHPQVGLVWDTHHPWRFFNEPLTESWERLRPWVRHTHWKDSVLLPEGYKPPTTEQTTASQQATALMAGHRHADYVLFLGGEFPARECLKLLLDSGYNGWHSLEWEKMWHPELLGPEVALPLFPPKLRFLAETLA